jgi:catalase
VRTPPEGADKPDPAAIEAFSKANPETTRQAAWVKEHALPAGYAGTTYFGIHAFTLTNAAGEKKLVKLKAIPSDGEKGLSDDEAKAKGTDFYEADFKEHLAKGPAKFEFVAVPRQGERPDKRSHAAMGRRGREAYRTARHHRDRRDRAQRDMRCDHLPAGQSAGGDRRVCG